MPGADSDTVVIQISVDGITPCNEPTTEQFTMNVIKTPVVSMTTLNDTVCSSQLTYNLTGNSVEDPNNTLIWTRVNPVGTGTFSNPNDNADITDIINILWSFIKFFIWKLLLFNLRCGFPNICISSFFLSTLTPIIFKNFIAKSNLGLSFLFNSPRFLNAETPLDFAATKNINKNLI